MEPSEFLYTRLALHEWVQNLRSVSNSAAQLTPDFTGLAFPGRLSLAMSCLPFCFTGSCLVQEQAVPGSGSQM